MTILTCLMIAAIFIVVGTTITGNPLGDVVTRGIYIMYMIPTIVFLLAIAGVLVVIEILKPSTWVKAIKEYKEETKNAENNN